MTNVQLTNKDAFNAHIEGLMRYIHRRYPQASLEWAHVGEVMAPLGPPSTAELR